MRIESTRRELLRGAAAISAMCGLGAAAERPAAADRMPGIKIGIATLGFGDHTNAGLARELAGAGIRLVQLFLNQKDSKFWKYNGRTDVSSMTPERCREIAAAYRDAGVEIHSIGVYTNLIHPDEAERAANLAYFDAMMAVGGHMGVRTFITEAGHFHDDKAPAPRIAIEFQDEVWPRTVDVVRQLGALAEKRDAKVLLEPFYRGFLASAKRVRTFVEAVASPRVRVLLDPANLIEVNDIDEMFAQLGPWIDCLHAKDRKLHVERGVAAGKGDVDYRRFVTLAAKRAPEAPLVLEYVGPKDYKEALAHLRAAVRDAGLQGA